MIPISTDSPVRCTPWANYALIVLNALMLIATMGLGDRGPLTNWSTSLQLRTADPSLLQFFTYQFLHADMAHLAGNMLFLWVFGNSVNGAFGHAGYVMFYLAGGVMAGLGFAIENSDPNLPRSLVGASGSVAAITTAFLALFPRNHVRLLYWFFIIGFFELRAVLIIVFKIVLWDNILEPRMMQNGSPIAYSAHLAGYAYGFTATLLLLAVRALPRDQFDMLALIKRWNQRRAFSDAMREPAAEAAAKFGRVARPISMGDVEAVQKSDAQIDEITKRRERIAAALGATDPATAAREYLALLEVDETQVLPRRQQIEVCNQLYAEGRSVQAAAGYERFLRHYGQSPEAAEMRLLLGIIYARDLEQYEAAERHLKDVGSRLTDNRRIEQHREWLSVVLAHLGRPTTES